jgi:8-oxo-dGTP pyrophosphatase MutT (NUDIX family)
VDNAVDSQANQAELAATVVLLRDSADGLEVLMLERPGKGTFAGAWVFPGGKVDPEDYVAAEAEAGGPAAADTAVVNDLAQQLAAARNAGVRETFEETGLRISGQELVHLSNWVPRHSLVRRFQTWFFVAAAPVGEVQLNDGELAGYAWLSPREALSRHQSGSMQLVPPTWVTLHELSGFATVADALEAARGAQPFDFESYVIEDPDTGHAIVWAGDDAYPGPSAAASTGARHRLSTGSLPWRYERDR